MNQKERKIKKCGKILVYLCGHIIIAKISNENYSSKYGPFSSRGVPRHFPLISKVNNGRAKMNTFSEPYINDTPVVNRRKRSDKEKLQIRSSM